MEPNLLPKRRRLSLTETTLTHHHSFGIWPLANSSVAAEGVQMRDSGEIIPAKAKTACTSTSISDFLHTLPRLHFGRRPATPECFFLVGPIGTMPVVTWHRFPNSGNPAFHLSLFMVIISDQCLFRYFRDSYPVWRKHTNYPKFGWSGFGPHNENPFKILWVPEREAMVNNAQVIAMIPDFVRFWIDESKSFFHQNLPDIDVTGYFEAIRHDHSHEFNLGTVVPRVKSELQALTKC